MYNIPIRQTSRLAFCHASGSFAQKWHVSGWQNLPDTGKGTPKNQGGFSAYMFLHCRAGRNLHSNYTLKLAKCKERYAFFSRIVQNIDFIFRVFHKKRSAFSTKTIGFLELAPADRRKREFFAKKRFPQVFLFGGFFVENTSAVIRNGFPQC